MATWNVQGCSTYGRSVYVDCLCEREKLDIICLQDIRITTPTFVTDHFLWVTSNYGLDKPTRRVNGFMIRKTLQCKFHYIYHDAFTQMLLVQTKGKACFILVNSYMPCSGTPLTLSAYSSLDSLLDKLEIEYPLVPVFCCGDFNCHLGRDLIKRGEVSLGPYLHHDIANESGSFLYSLMIRRRMIALTTMLHSSTMISRAQGESVSQLDHVLTKDCYRLLITGMLGAWGGVSDHKCISFNLTLAEGDWLRVKSLVIELN